MTELLSPEADQTPAIDISEISAQDLPGMVKTWFGGRSEPAGEVVQASSRLLTVEVEGDTDVCSYALAETRTYAGRQEPTGLLYIIDISSAGRIMGYGEVRRNSPNDPSYIGDEPYVRLTATREGFLRQGLGQRRLLAMNGLTQHEWGVSLHSATVDVTLDPAAERLWQRLVAAGLAERYEAAGQGRYRFV